MHTYRKREKEYAFIGKEGDRRESCSLYLHKQRGSWWRRWGETVDEGQKDAKFVGLQQRRQVWNSTSFSPRRVFQMAAKGNVRVAGGAPTKGSPTTWEEAMGRGIVSKKKGNHRASPELVDSNSNTRRHSSSFDSFLACSWRFPPPAQHVRLLLLLLQC